MKEFESSSLKTTVVGENQLSLFKVATRSLETGNSRSGSLGLHFTTEEQSDPWNDSYLSSTLEAEIELESSPKDVASKHASRFKL